MLVLIRIKVGILLLFLYTNLVAQVSISPIPKWVTDIPFSTVPTEDQNGKGGLQILVQSQQFHLPLKREYFKLIYRIDNETGLQEGSVIQVTHDPSFQKLRFTSLNIWRNGNRIAYHKNNTLRKLDREQRASEFIYDQNVTYLINLNDIRKGDIIEYSYEIEGFNPVFKNHFCQMIYLNSSYPISQIYHRVIAAKGSKIQNKLLNSDMKLETKELPSQLIEYYIRNSEPVQAIIVQDDVPYWYNPYGIWEVTTFQDWSEVKTWANNLFEVTGAPSKLLLHIVDSLKSTSRNDEEYLTKATRFVQNQIRYTGEVNGIYGFKPHNPNQILKQRYGDCKDKSLLLCKMITIFGLKAYPVLVHSRRRKEINYILPSISAFDHCIVMVKFGVKTKFVDPTLTNQGGWLSDVYTPNYQTGLVINDNSTSLTQIPNSFRSKVEFKEDYEINTFDMPARLFGRISFYGYEADQWRTIFINNTPDEISKMIVEYYATIYPYFTLNKTPSYTDDLINNVFLVSFNATIDPIFVPYDGSDSLKVKALFSPKHLIAAIPAPKERKRTMPIYQQFPGEVDYQFRVLLPKDWEIKPDKFHMENNFFSYHSDVNIVGNELSLSYHFIPLVPEIGVKDAPSYFRDYDRVANDLGYVLFHVKNGQQNTSTSSSDALIIRILLALLSILVAIAIVFWLHYKYDPLPETDYDEAGFSSMHICYLIWLIGSTLLRFAVLFLVPSYFNSNTIQLIKEAPNGTTLNTLVAIELCFSITVIVLSIALIVWFLAKRTLVPRVIQILTSAILLFTVIEAYTMNSLKLESEAHSVWSIALQIISSTAIIVYFTFAPESRWVFVNRLHKKANTLTN